jgi:Cu(I)/Ag(I) efflux system membrane protein CusA/SilA
MAATGRLDTALRGLILGRYAEFETRLDFQLTREFIAQLVGTWRSSGQLLQSVDDTRIDWLAHQLSAKAGPWLAAGAAQEDVNQLIRQVADTLDQEKIVDLRQPRLMDLPRGPIGTAWSSIMEQLGVEPQTLFTSMQQFIQQRRERAWSEMSGKLDYEVFDQAVGAFDWYCIVELRKSAAERTTAGHPASAATGGASQVDKETAAQSAELQSLRADLDKRFGRGLLLWQTSKEDLVKEMDSTIQVPGWSNIFTQPIINRIDMLATGVRTMIGVKVFGTDLKQIQTVSQEVADVLKMVPGALSPVPDQIIGKGYLEITINRQKAARYGVNVGDVQDVIEVALGGKPITSTVEGRERFPIRIRYARDFRVDEDQIKNLLINAAGSGGGIAGNSSSAMGRAMNGDMAKTGPPARPLQVPLASVADVRIVEGPSEIKSENGMLRAYVQLNVNTPDLVGFVEQAQRQVERKVKLPTGMHLEWSGQFEHKLRADRTMRWIMPLVLILIFVILYLTYQDFMDAVLMMMAVPEALVGGVFFLWLTGHSYSVAVQVGFIACFGMATETGIIMLVYLRESLERRGGLENIKSLDELKQAVVEGAVHRLRPKLLTEGVAIVALAPMLWATGVGHEVLSAMAAPVLGGLLVSDEVVDLFLPVRFYWVRRHRWLKMHGAQESASPSVHDRATAGA